MDYVFTNSQIHVISSGTNGFPIRVSRRDVIDQKTNKKVGVIYSQTYVYPGNHTGGSSIAIGSFAIDFNNGNVLLGKFTTLFVDPNNVSNPGAVDGVLRTITGGSGKFENVYWGIVDSSSVDSIQDPEHVSIRYAMNVQGCK